MATVHENRSTTNMHIPPLGNHDKSDRKIYGVYMRSVLQSKVVLFMTEIGKNVKANLVAKIVAKIAGKCIADGYVKPNSIKIISYSSGLVLSDYIEFQVVYECMVCLPVDGMLMECTCKTVTKAGIHAQVIDDEENMPVTVFVARDHHYLDKRFDTIQPNEKLTVRVIGTRFELNDPYICVIAKLTDVQDAAKRIVVKKNPRISIIGGLDDERHGGGDSDNDD